MAQMQACGRREDRRTVPSTRRNLSPVGCLHPQDRRKRIQLSVAVSARVICWESGVEMRSDVAAGASGMYVRYFDFRTACTNYRVLASLPLYIHYDIVVLSHIHAWHEDILETNGMVLYKRRVRTESSSRTPYSWGARISRNETTESLWCTP